MYEEINKYFDAVVLSSSVAGLKDKFLKAVVINDTRSAVYYAVGIAAETGKRVAVITSGNNESRSAFTGMTEAYYRHLPVVLFTLGNAVDYSKSLKDTSESIFHIGVNDIFPFLKDCALPAHIIVDDYSLPIKQKEITLDHLNSILTEKDYLYWSKNILLKNNKLLCHQVNGGLPGCYEGAIANLLGASLTHKHERYLGILTEDEFLHDMNTIGNVCYNDSIRLICLKKNPIWIDCVKSLGLAVVVSVEELSQKKSILFTDSELL